MFSNHTRVLALTSALFFAALGAASASPARNIPVHGAQPHSHAFMASSHGMMASNKHNFDASHHFTSAKPGHHGFSNGSTNRRRPH